MVLAVEKELVTKHGAAQAERITRGLAQVRSLWRPVDGDAAALAAFAREHFLSDPAKLDTTFQRFEDAFEALDGHFNEIGRELRRPTELDVGPLLPVDALFAGYEPAAHMVEDLFRSKLAFVALLNFPLTTLKERLEGGPKYSRRLWAEVRLAGRFARRVPAEVAQEITRAGADADLYIAEYNLWMHHLVDAQGMRPFPKGLRLISHWNLRDQIKADYAGTGGRNDDGRQRMIAEVMARIVTQSIPAAVIDNPRLDWDPFTNRVAASPPSEIEAEAPARAATAAEASQASEPDTRYKKLLANFRAARAADPFSPTAPTAIARSFDLGRELPEERVKALLLEVLTSPHAPKVAAVIEKRLGRKLAPHDLWYSGFQSRAKFPEAELDALTRKRYPTAEAFAADIPRILEQLGFPKERARYLAAHIVVDASRGAGHAMQSMRRGDLPHLRTRVEKGGMNYKGYNIAVHELGHNVEQVFSLYDVDHTLLKGIPNTAFTEAMAFVFQARDLELLGLQKPDAESERLRVLNDFWATFEIAGVALVDIAVWHWMYDHPAATPAELRAATVQIARETWNRYYAPLLGGKDTLLLGIYSHMISYPLYLPDYPIGHLIAFQIEEQMKRKGPLGVEFERMAREGAVTPDLWMVHATGAPVGAGPLLQATAAALSGH
ncbi:MAG: hypothetical protein EXR72_11525 [Myxococcales bacterium]|nr:hypothetical protein [Myxococcales bacterium]